MASLGIKTGSHLVALGLVVAVATWPRDVRWRKRGTKKVRGEILSLHIHLVMVSSLGGLQMVDSYTFKIQDQVHVLIFNKTVR